MNWETHYFLPISFACPVCGKKVQSTPRGEEVYCDCIRIPYLGKLPGIIPGPGEIIPKLQAGEAVDYVDIEGETSFRWGRLVDRLKAASEKGAE